ncbi:MAG: type II toxin-antitoxin system VapC family toxin [Planctomycetes bacterium]|nr:type II toxin-antitoxin system VapC family toxin [Planctomycetota bacterium]
MQRIILDTSAYSAFLRGHPEVKREVQAAEDIVLTAVVVGELIAGFLGGSRPTENRRKLQAFIASPRVRVLGVDEETAERYGLVQDSLRKAGTPIPTNDIWIAASAMQHGLRVVTTDVHFRQVPQVMGTIYEV